jgi:hypothetical protein
VIIILALVVGVAMGVGMALWLSRPAPVVQPVAVPIPETDRVLTAPMHESSGRFRVVRERNGEVVEVLHQGGGARAAQQYDYHNPTQPGEVIAFYRGSDRCSAKGQ